MGDDRAELVAEYGSIDTAAVEAEDAGQQDGGGWVRRSGAGGGSGCAIRGGQRCHD